MIRTRVLADGVMEIRLVGDDGNLDAIVELTRPAYHGLLVAYLLRWQDECQQLESEPPACEAVIRFPCPVPSSKAETIQRAV
jgi:hypothetical protein